MHLHEAERHTRLFEHLGLPPAGPAAMTSPISLADEAEHAAARGSGWSGPRWSRRWAVLAAVRELAG